MLNNYARVAQGATSGGITRGCSLQAAFAQRRRIIVQLQGTYSVLLVFKANRDRHITLQMRHPCALFLQEF